MRNRLRQFASVGLGLCLGIFISFGYSAVAQRETLNALPVAELRAFADVYERIKSDYVDPVDDKKLIDSAIAGMLSGLDPHSSFLDRTAFRDLRAGTSGEFGGLGMEVDMEDGLVKVVSPIDGTPAARAGIEPGDVIVKLGETSVQGMSLADAVSRMRGKPDTQIALTIMRKGQAQPLVFNLTRAVIKIQSVRSKLIEPGYAYARVTEFQQNSGEVLAAAIEKLIKQNQGPLKGIMLDLRNDPGGLLNEAVAVAAVFLPQNALVVSTAGRAEDAKMTLTAAPQHYLHGRVAADYIAQLPPEVKTIPLVVLVNSGSASASEIVTGALQDHHRAVVMGSRTFGKGSVQTILPIGSGNEAIRLTTARYYTPNGRSIQAQGIVPDIVLNDGIARGSLRVREADLDKHLTNEAAGDRAAPGTANAFGFTPAPPPQGLTEKDLIPGPGEIIAKKDDDVAQALAFLKSRPADAPPAAASAAPRTSL